MEDCTLMLASSQVRIHKAHRSTIYIRVRSNPVIEESTALRFAPFAFSYPGSDAALKECGLHPDSGQWQKVGDFDCLGAATSPNWCV
jgi:tubulin-specific chaperone C